MWIADYQISWKDNAGNPSDDSSKMRSILLRKGNLYTIGRQASSDICVDHPKVSRSQVELKVNAEGDLEIKNIGHASLSCGKTTIEGKTEKPHLLTSSSVFKLKAAKDWKIVFHKLEDITVSKYVYEKVFKTINLDYKDDLSNNEVLIGNIKNSIDNVDTWIDTLLSRQWEKSGGIARIILPQSKQCEPKTLSKKDSLMKKMVEVTPMSQDSPYSLLNRSSKRTRKSQLQSVFDDLENLEDSSSSTSTKSTQKYTIASQNTMRSKKSQLTQFFDDMDESEPILNTNSIPKQDFNLKDEQPDRIDGGKDERVLDLENTTISNTSLPIKRPVEVSSGFPAKKLKSVKPKEALVDIFKKTKQMKIERLEKENELIDSMKNSNGAKVSKFKVVRNVINPQVYSGHKVMYNNDPKWENRLNYSKFSKINNNTNYNPILDSTIKTVKFRSSNYKSNERQANLFQNDDMIAEIDTLFESRHRKSDMSSRNRELGNRKKEPTLFVDSDYEDTQYNTNESYSLSNSKAAGKNDTNNQHFGVFNTSSGTSPLTSHVLQDDETPVFRSRRR
ncbi:hypothetical protein CANINC_002586 [Pichia inconspicua]|uniref:FHA domain-containing protein n=1 Tax=Pichia inconspicua TaxID=52247 RepID=A0A4T0X174_9ASCO|nr:hypothetical protein CANINC_002586 [[Candida] inconspicua]